MANFNIPLADTISVTDASVSLTVASTSEVEEIPPIEYNASSGTGLGLGLTSYSFSISTPLDDRGIFLIRNSRLVSLLSVISVSPKAIAPTEGQIWPLGLY